MYLQHSNTLFRIQFLVLFALAFTVLGTVLFQPHTASAQTKLEFSGASLKLEPRYPEPQSSVTVSLDAYTYDTAGAVIVWKVDGKERIEFENERAITLTTGAMGDSMLVTATVLSMDGSGFTLKKEIIPATLDIIVEADTYVPPFYRGRALGTTGALLRVVALPHNGKTVSSKNLTYTWEHNEAILFGGPVREKESVTIFMPEYSGGYIKVTVVDDDRNTLAEKAISIEAVTPELYFYEENLLRGLSEIAIKEKYALIGDETTIHGEPYFFTKGVSAQDLDFKWSINGEEAENDTTDPHVLTLRKTGASGSALVKLRSLTKTLIPDYVQGQFTITF